MVSFDDAQAIVQASVAALGRETAVLNEAAGRVLAEPVIARIDAPRHDVSAMDGYAVADATTNLGDTLKIVGESFAGGEYARAVGAGEAARIFTGAPLPAGTDRVIIQENVDRDGQQACVARDYGPGWHVRSRASDFAAGDQLLPAGTLLTPRAILAAAGADRSELVVSKQPAIAIIGTGDELTEPGTAADRPNSIPNSVTYGLAAYAAALGGKIVSNRQIADRLPELEAAAAQALECADLVLVTGGASVGEKDFAKTMFAPHGLDLLFSKVAIKPGKPVWFARSGRTLVLGLPGNPTSAMVTARLFLAPVMAALQGQTSPAPVVWREFPLAEPIGGNSSRETFVRARWGVDGLIPLTDQSSGSQSPLTQADWLIRRLPHCDAQQRGDYVCALGF